jgi:hypothetical protein
MAFWNNDDAEGAANSRRIMFAPLLWPASVIFFESPPKEGTTLAKNLSAVMVSFTARLVDPSGAKRPSLGSF